MKRLNVLVADDNSDAADTLAHLIELAGHDVTVRYDGWAALAAAETIPTSSMAHPSGPCRTRR